MHDTHARRRTDSKELRDYEDADITYLKKRAYIRECSRRKVCLIVFIACLILYFLWNIGSGSLYHVILEALFTARYVVIIDAGSTGSRIHVFKLIPSGDGYIMLEDNFKALEPGLSSYGEDSKKAADSLKPLLDYAMLHIPPNQVATVPVQLKATAGLRILSKQSADEILRETEMLIHESYGFKRAGKSKTSEIMEGNDEGVFAWITLNYYLGKMQSAPIDTVALDLGGGSFQLTFQVERKKDLLYAIIEKDVHEVQLAGSTRDVYVKSYLGMGLKEARLALMETLDDESLTSPCLPAKYDGDWDYQGKIYRTRGTNKSGFLTCLESMQNKFMGKIDAIKEIMSKKIYVFSYFFDKARDSGLVEDTSGGIVTVQQFRKAAKETCDKQLVDQRFQCLDLTYIVYLLNYAYGLPSDFELHVTKKINGEEVAWALGAAFNLLDSLQS